MKKNDTLVSASEFKKHFLNLVDEVKNNKSSFVITKRKVPIAKVIPLENNTNDKIKSYFGFMKGIAQIKDDIVNYSSESDWEVNHD